MKNVVTSLIGIALIAAGCSSNTYSNLRRQEDRLIANYISRNQLNIITEEPDENYEWDEKDYYKVKGRDNLYFHLIRRGPSSGMDATDSTEIDMAVENNDVVIVRYKQFKLEENADTMSYWTTLDQPYPYEFHYNNLNDCEAVGWHEAVRLMKYSDSECQILVPSKLGFNIDQTTVTPYMYIMKIKIK